MKAVVADEKAQVHGPSLGLRRSVPESVGSQQDVTPVPDSSRLVGLFPLAGRTRLVSVADEGQRPGVGPMDQIGRAEDSHQPTPVFPLGSHTQGRSCCAGK